MRRLSLHVHVKGYQTAAPKYEHELCAGEWRKLYESLCDRSDVYRGSVVINPTLQTAIDLVRTYKNVHFSFFIKNLAKFVVTVSEQDLSSLVGLLSLENTNCTAYTSVGGYWQLVSEPSYEKIVQLVTERNFEAPIPSSDTKGRWTGGFPHIESALDGLPIAWHHYHQCEHNPECREALGRLDVLAAIYDDLPLLCQSLLSALVSRRDRPERIWSRFGSDVMAIKLLEDVGLVTYQNGRPRITSKALEVYIYDHHTWRGKVERAARSKSLAVVGVITDVVGMKVASFFQDPGKLIFLVFFTLLLSLALSIHAWSRASARMELEQVYWQCLVLSFLSCCIGILGLYFGTRAQRLAYRDRSLTDPSPGETNQRKGARIRWDLINLAAAVLLGTSLLLSFYTILEYEYSELSPNPEKVGLQIRYPPWIFSSDKSLVTVELRNDSQCPISGTMGLALTSDSESSAVIEPLGAVEFGPVPAGSKEIVMSWEIMTTAGRGRWQALLDFRFHSVIFNTPSSCTKEANAGGQKVDIEDIPSELTKCGFLVRRLAIPWRGREILETKLRQNGLLPLVFVLGFPFSYILTPKVRQLIGQGTKREEKTEE